MHTKIGEILDIRGAFDEKDVFLKISIFDVTTAICNFSRFPYFLPIVDLYRAFEILYIDYKWIF